MAKTQSMTRNQSHDNEASFSRMRSKTWASWSDLNHDVLFLVMMELEFGDFLSFRGVCKSWRSFAFSNKNKFMESRPPMSITISTDSNEKSCCLKDFEGRKFKTILPDFAGGDYIAFTCGYLVFYTRKTHDFCLLNPATRKQLHFPDFPFDFDPKLFSRAILVFSASISGWMFVAIYGGAIWFSNAGKGAWKHVPNTSRIIDVYAFKGKLYTLSSNNSYPVDHERCRLCELRLKPEPKVTLLKTNNHLSSEIFYPHAFVSSSENLLVFGWGQNLQYRVREVDLDEMKWVKPCEKTTKEYAFFRTDPWSKSHQRNILFYDTDKNRTCKSFTAKMWYFPHECMDVDRIDD